MPPKVRARSAGGTVLLVEDDDSLRVLTERILTRDGYTVPAAADATEAQQIAAARPDLDLLLTDVVMPDIDGHALATALQASRPSMRVTYTSGYTETILAARSTLPAGITLLNKPVTADHLLSAVARTLSTRSAPTTS